MVGGDVLETFDLILDRLLDGAREQFPELDTREGSLIYSALAPAAVELSRLYAALQFALEMSYADTASRDYLIRRAAERGIRPFPATAAVIEAVFEPEDIVVPLGTRFRANAMIYTMSGRSAEGNPLLMAQSAGAEGNASGGRLVPVDLVEGLRAASIGALAVPGRDVEDTEVFRARYIESHRAQSFGGNIAAYREKVLAMDGISGVRVFPVPDGPGTVRVAVLAADYRPPSTTLIATVQETLDPLTMGGEGRGWAPIGHRVTVVGAVALPIAVATTLQVVSGADRAVVEDAAWEVIGAYFLELGAAWDRGDVLTVRLSQIDTRLLDIPGVLDVADTALNGQRGNLPLGGLQVPQLEGLSLWNG